MKTENAQAVPAPPRLIATLRVGFDVITNHVGLILFAVALDLFLWWGPRLSLKSLILGLFDQMAVVPGAESQGTADVIGLTRDYWLPFAERFNIFSALRSYPVGIPSLMVSRMPFSAPFGSTPAWELNSFITGLGLWLLFSLVGLAAGALYFILVAQAVSGKVDLQQAFFHWPWAALQSVLLALFWMALILLFSIPLSCLITFLTLTGGLSLGQLGIALFTGMMIWILFPLLLSPHGIFLNRWKMWTSVKEGFRLTRKTVPGTAMLFLIVLLISQGLDVLWSVPPESSWMAVIGVIGHAFVTTGLLAATFVYYRDASRWVQRVEQQIKFLST